MSTPTAQRINDRYALPFMVRSKMSKPLRGICFLFFLVILLTVWLSLDSQIDSIRSLQNIQLSSDTVFFLFLAVIDLVIWLYIDVFHGLYVIGNKKGLRIKLFLQPERQIPWEQIGMVDMMRNEGPPRAKTPIRAEPGRATYVRLVLRETGSKNSIFHHYPKEYYIGRDIFPSLDLYRFINTVGAEMENAARRTKKN